MKNTFSNIEIITLAVYLLGGDKKNTDLEDIAVKANELAPRRFAWRKYPAQINIEAVKKRISDAKNPKKCGYLLGSFKEGWLLSEKGLSFAINNISKLKHADLTRTPMARKELAWQNREKVRLLASDAYKKIISHKADEITLREAEDFFRLDEYLQGTARDKKITRLVNTFANDQELKPVLAMISKKVRHNERIDK